MEPTIDKKTFKITYGQAVAVLVSVISITLTVYGFINTNNSRIDKLDAKVSTEIQSVKSTVEIVSLKQTNQYQSTKNDRKRDSTDNANNFKALTQEVKDMKSILYRLDPFPQKQLTSN